tara:strand:- start:384 stop:1589 length:1206 start_codon:yes stop_codon:yes gene_type:complete
MEENIEVKAVEVKEETSPQEKEAAVLEQAIESGEVDSNYGFQDDGVYRVNVDAPPTQEADASEKQSTDEVSVRDEPEASEEVREKNEQESIEELTEQSEEKEEKETLEIVEESEQEIVQDAEQDVVQTNEYPEDVQKLVEFMQDTNGTLEDYVNLNRDYSKMDNTTLVYEYYKNNKPHLNNEDINFLMQKDFAYDEEVAEPAEIKAKQLAFKEELYKAQKHFNDSKEKYYADLKLRKQNEVPEEYKEAQDFYNEATKIQEKAEKLKNTFDTRTNNFFSQEFKGFDFKVGDKKYRFKVDDAKKVKTAQSTINNFIKPYLNKEGEMEKVGDYHKALFAGRNADKIAAHFYEQGRADAIKETVKKSKNIDMTPRSDNSAVQNPNSKVRVVENDSSNRLRIKWNK